MKRSTLEAHSIAHGLWQGSVPTPGHEAARAGFDTIVFCAQEYQPPSFLYPGTHVVRAPFADDYEKAPSRKEIVAARRAGRLAAQRVQEGGKVLVTCIAGRNRSGLVSAYALCHLYGLSGDQAMILVRRRRKHAKPVLENPHFVRLLERVKSTRHAKTR